MFLCFIFNIKTSSNKRTIASRSTHHIQNKKSRKQVHLPRSWENESAEPDRLVALPRYQWYQQWHRWIANEAERTNPEPRIDPPGLHPRPCGCQLLRNQCRHCCLPPFFERTSSLGMCGRLLLGVSASSSSSFRLRRHLHSSCCCCCCCCCCDYCSSSGLVAVEQMQQSRRRWKNRPPPQTQQR